MTDEKRPVGRPRIIREYMVSLSTRLPVELSDRLDAYCIEQNLTKASVVALAVAEYLEHHEGEER